MNLLGLLGVIGVTLAPMDYATARQYVERGGSVVLYVGLPVAPSRTQTARAASLPGIVPGVYRCYRDPVTGEPKMVLAEVQIVAESRPVARVVQQLLGVCVGNA